MGMLVDSPTVRAGIKKAIEIARKQMVPLSEVMDMAKLANQDSSCITLKDKKREKAVRKTQPVEVLIPEGYTANISFEEQPVGICKHLSIGFENSPGKMPHPLAVQIVADMFGMKWKADEPWEGSRIWMEEFAPGEFAINIVELESGEIPIIN